MTRAKAKPTTAAVLLELDTQLLGALDLMWQQVGYPSRRAAIRGAIEQMLAAHAAHVQRERRAAAAPYGSFTPATADTAAEAASRPLTADLTRL